jgi:ubiquinone/menaquinone biosynthesis C-methylase UbiE
MTTVREAYDASAGAWGSGPDHVFSALAAALLARGPRWQGLSVVDIGAGTGTATRRLAAAGAWTVAVDAADAMLSVARAYGASSALVGDALALPLRADSSDAVVLGFVLNHLARPGDALREAARVVRPGGWVLASTWARDDAHPVREIVQQAMLDRGWRIPAWYQSLKDTTTHLSDTPEALDLLARAAGLTAVDATRLEVPVRASARELLEWRLGMPHTAPFVAALPRAEQRRLWRELLAVADTQPPLVCRVVLLVSRVP